MILKSGTYRTASIKIAVLFSSIIFISSCIKKERFDKFEMDPANMGWGLPIIDSKLTLKDIVSTIKDNKNLDASLLDSSYTFTYYDTLKTVSAEKLVLLPSQQISTQISLPNNFPVLLPAGQEIPGNFNGKEVIAFAANAQLKSILFKEGTMNVAFTSTLKHSISATVSIPSLTKSGIAYTHVFNIPFSNGSSTPAAPNNLDLNGYTLDLKGSGVEVNTVLYTVSYKITGSGQPVSPTDKMMLNLGFSGLKFKTIIGNFAGLTLDPYSGSTDIKVFDNALQGNVFFEQATFILKVTNSFGIPISIKVDSMETETAYGKKISVTGNKNEALINDGKGVISFSSPSSNQIGTEKVTEIIFNKNNSNIKEMINPAPNKLRYVMAPKFTNTGGDQFITDQSKLEVAMRVIIPINGILEFYLLGDTLGVDKFPARSGDEWTLDSVRFTFKTTNSLPVDAMTQLYFVDSLGNRIDSLLNNPNAFIRRPLINDKGKSIEEAEQTTKVYMGGKRYDKIMAKTKNIYIVSRVLSSKNNQGVQQNIQLFSYNYLRIQICALAIGQARPKLQ